VELKRPQKSVKTFAFVVGGRPNVTQDASGLAYGVEGTWAMGLADRRIELGVYYGLGATSHLMSVFSYELKPSDGIEKEKYGVYADAGVLGRYNFLSVEEAYDPNFSWKNNDMSFSLGGGLGLATGSITSSSNTGIMKYKAIEFKIFPEARVGESFLFGGFLGIHKPLQYTFKNEKDKDQSTEAVPQDLNTSSMTYGIKVGWFW